MTMRTENITLEAAAQPLLEDAAEAVAVTATLPEMLDSENHCTPEDRISLKTRPLAHWIRSLARAAADDESKTSDSPRFHAFEKRRESTFLAMAYDRLTATSTQLECSGSSTTPSNVAARTASVAAVAAVSKSLQNLENRKRRRRWSSAIATKAVLSRTRHYYPIVALAAAIVLMALVLFCCSKKSTGPVRPPSNFGVLKSRGSPSSVLTPLSTTFEETTLHFSGEPDGVLFETTDSPGIIPTATHAASRFDNSIKKIWRYPIFNLQDSKSSIGSSRLSNLWGRRQLLNSPVQLQAPMEKLNPIDAVAAVAIGAATSNNSSFSAPEILVPSRQSPQSDRQKEPVSSFARADLWLCLLLAVYIGSSFVFQSMTRPILHESLLVVLLGSIVGLYFTKAGTSIVFDFNLFNYILLPPIIFAAGFNLRRESFFRYFGYVISFGLLMTILVFAGLTIFLVLVRHYFGPFTTWAGAPVPQLPLELLFALSATLCCSDTVASMALLKPESLPSAYTVTFGEGIMNDVIAIILCQSLISISRQFVGSTGSDTVTILVASLCKHVAYYLLMSSLVGVIFGLTISYVSKRFRRSLNRDPVRAVALLLTMGYSSYIVSELCGLSAILTIFVTAIISSHYSWHSLTPTGRILATKSSAMIGFLAEAFVFGYFGLAASNFLRHPETFSPGLILTYSSGIVITRILALPIILLLVCLMTLNWSLALSQRDIAIVMLVGMARGIVSYAITIHYVQQSGIALEPLGALLLTTVLGTVLINIGVFGVVLPISLSLLTHSKAAFADLEEEAMVQDARHLVGAALEFVNMKRWHNLLTLIRDRSPTEDHEQDARLLQLSSQLVVQPQVDHCIPATGNTNVRLNMNGANVVNHPISFLTQPLLQDGGKYGRGTCLVPARDHLAGSEIEQPPTIPLRLDRDNDKRNAGVAGAGDHDEALADNLNCLKNHDCQLQQRNKFPQSLKKLNGSKYIFLDENLSKASFHNPNSSDSSKPGDRCASDKVASPIDRTTKGNWMEADLQTYPIVIVDSPPGNTRKDLLSEEVKVDGWTADDAAILGETILRCFSTVGDQLHASQQHISPPSGKFYCAQHWARDLHDSFADTIFCDGGDSPTYHSLSAALPQPGQVTLPSHLARQRLKNNQLPVSSEDDAPLRSYSGGGVRAELLRVNGMPQKQPQLSPWPRADGPSEVVGGSASSGSERDVRKVKSAALEKVQRTFVQWWTEFDELVMKPLFGGDVYPRIVAEVPKELLSIPFANQSLGEFA